MKVYVKDQEYEIREDSTVLDFLFFLGFTKNVAVWVNKKQIFFNDYTSHKLKDQDIVIIIKPMAGG